MFEQMERILIFSSMITYYCTMRGKDYEMADILNTKQVYIQ